MARQEFDWQLPKEISDRLGNESYGAQRSIHEKDHLLVVLHEPPQRQGHRREHAVFLRKPDGTWLYHGSTPGEFAFSRLQDQYAKALASLEDRYGEADTATELFQVVDQLVPLARAAGNMKATLQSAREAVRQDKLLITLRDRAVELSRGLDLLLADARLALDYRLARSAEEQTQAAIALNKAQHKLNTIAAITFPLMTIGAVFGMNLHSGVENLGWPVFWLVFAAGLVLGLAVKSWVQPAVAAAVKKGQGQRDGKRPGPAATRPR